MRLARRLAVQFEPSTSSFQEVAAALLRRMREISNQKTIRSLEDELPDFLLVFSLAIKSGASVPNALQYFATCTKGTISREIHRVVSDVELGANLVDELKALAVRLPSPRFEEFTQTLVANLELGVAISESLLEQSKSATDEFSRRLAKQAASNETRMLVPTIFLILPVTVLFAIFPSLVMLTAKT